MPAYGAWVPVSEVKSVKGAVMLKKMCGERVLLANLYLIYTAR